MIVAWTASQASAERLAPIIQDPTEIRAVRSGEKPPVAAASSKTATKASTINIDQDHSQLTMTGHFVAATGMVELGACTKIGRTFLSLLCLDARPSEIADALKALGVAPGEVPIVNRPDSSIVPPKGRHVTLTVEWATTINGQASPRKERLERLFWNRAKDKLLPDGPWIYAGSKSIRDEASGFEIFVADLSGSVATINRADTSALFYYGGDTPAVQTYQANPAMRPPAGTACRLIVEVLPEEKPPEPPAAPAAETSTKAAPPKESPKTAETAAQAEEKPAAKSQPPAESTAKAPEAPAAPAETAKKPDHSSEVEPLPATPPAAPEKRDAAP
jgi:hypothetical protein